MHAQLLDAYRGLLDEPDQWWTLPIDEPYVWQHLAEHFVGAGDRDTLVATVTDPAYLVKRIARDGPYAGEADLAVTARLLPMIRCSRGGGHGWPGTPTCLAAVPAVVRADGTDRRHDVRLAEGRSGATRQSRAGAPGPLLPRPYLALRDGMHAEPSALVRVLTGHVGWVHALAWSPDGTRLATGGNDGTARIWNPTTGQTLTQLTGHIDRVLAVAWSPDGTRVATAGRRRHGPDPDPTTGKTLLQLTGHAGVLAIAWSPDGTRVATAGKDGTARIWNATTGETLSQLTGHIRCRSWPGRPTAPGWPPGAIRHRAHLEPHHRRDTVAAHRPR